MVMSWFYVNILLLNTYILNIQQYKMGNRQNEERLPLWFVCAFICKPCENTLVGYTNYIDYTWLWCITIQCGVEWVNVVYNYKLVWSQKIGRKIVLSDLTIWQNIFYIIVVLCKRPEVLDYFLQILYLNTAMTSFEMYSCEKKVHTCT